MNIADRNHFRIEYPREVAPVVIFKTLAYPIFNLSECGVLLDGKKKLKVKPGQKVKGTVVFSDGEKASIEGSIVRIADYKIALHLTTGISFQKIMSEQRFLLNKYGTFKQPDLYFKRDDDD
ncbi:MAG: hypothetical protein CMP10_20905 [Zetaproteobacteria bacterium]|nr:hypothetical protein [Pseudobdellovibrionaceae bacterium]|tara:strand:- start:116 stop:478 length:363 start_codon:yes stop_codon:yes gene_type:complete